MPPITIIIIFTLHLAAILATGLSQNNSGYTKQFRVVLGIFSAIGSLVSLIFLINYGFKTIWYYPLIMLAISFILSPILVAIINNIFSGLIVSILFLISIPVLSVLIFITV